ncbi:MAG: polyribonucleotide nucleotidyltransferase [Rickettsiales bacterium]|nr:polyribonucleotide nucleotidyltransferase [Rickettsiales bacterium]
MFKIVKKELNWNGKTLTLETGKIARQASGSIIAKYGETTILCAVTVASKAAEGADFFPLTVNYIEKHYSVGRIPGGFIKRESKPSEESTLISRLIDRPIRPLFPANFYNEVNVVCTVLSYDPSDNADVIALIGASAALAISEAPFLEPVSCSRVGLVDGEFVLNPSQQQIKSGSLDLVVAGTESSVLMVESEAKQLTEEQMLAAVDFGHKAFQPVIAMINELKQEVGKEKIKIIAEDNSSLKNEIKNIIGNSLIEAYKIKEKQQRSSKIEEIKTAILNKFVNDNNNSNKINYILKNLEQEIVRGDILKNSIRIDGRKVDEIRPINVEIGLLPKVHGSALFTRGETQALVVTTLGSARDGQMVESLNGTFTENFMLHYNFPPYSVGEVGQLKAPGRREIGHGKLAWRAINPILPDVEQFSYVTRIVSEITESNGSSSMASVCGASLALMDAGVPIKEPVSGIAMGLIKEGNDYVILSDIMGDEDHLGDMDFKVAGTKNGITALQMDIKINGINIEIMQRALHQANQGRLHILGKMTEVIAEPKKELSPNIPRVETINIPAKKIRDVIGSRGSVIKGICANTGVVIDVEDDGTVKISGNNNDGIKKAIEMIGEIIFEPEVGDIYEGPVVKVIDAGAFVAIANNRDGFVHISELADYRVDFVEDIINEGDIVKVKVIGFDKKGRPKLSFRSVDQKTGEDISDKIPVKNVEEKDYDRFEKRGSNNRREGRGDDRHERRGDRNERGDRNDRGDRDDTKKRRGFFS